MQKTGSAAATRPQRRGQDAGRALTGLTTPVDGHHGRPYNFALSSTWGHSSAGRAPAWHAGGRRFDPAWLHHVFRCTGRTENEWKKSFTASPSSRGLGHYPFTVATGVRIPVGTPLLDGPGHSGPIFFEVPKARAASRRAGGGRGRRRCYGDACRSPATSSSTGRSVATPWPLSARYCSHLPRKVFIRIRWSRTSAGGGYMPITSCHRRPM